MKPPSYYEQAAIELLTQGNWEAAAVQFDYARGASVGHTRRDRYERRADNCRTQAKQAACTHNFNYIGHGHNYSIYKCTACGFEKET